MTRRQVILASALVTGALVDPNAQSGGLGKHWKWHPGTLTFDLRVYTKYIFMLDGKTVSFTPEEVMAGLAEGKL